MLRWLWPNLEFVVKQGLQDPTKGGLSSGNVGNVGNVGKVVELTKKSQRAQPILTQR